MPRYSKLTKRFLLGFSSLFLLGIVSFLWAKKQYPSLAKDFWVSHSWEISEEAILAKMDIGDYRNHTLRPAIEHRVLNLNQSENWTIPEAFFAGLDPKADLVVSIQCWGSKYWPVYRSAPLAYVSAGAYDAKISELALKLRALNKTVYLRFNPQMEVPSYFYPWQEYPMVYIDAFKHVYSLVKELNPALKILWSPAGYPGLEEYYPGKDFVDALGISLIADSEAPLNIYPKQKAIVELRRRLHRLRFFEGPCLIFSGEKQTIDPQEFQNLVHYQQQNPLLFDLSSTKVDSAEAYTYEAMHIGLYDPKESLVDNKALTVEHIFTNITSLKEEKLAQQIEAVAKRNHDLILTLETINDSNDLREEKGLEKLLSGNYDPCLEILWEMLEGFDQTIYLRFSQEMEIPISRYPWQSKEPKLYIDAYRYLMLRAKSTLPKVKCIWGPAGDRGSLEWYPGGDLVDYISIAIYGLPDKNIIDPFKQEQFGKIFERKFWRMRQAGKPIFITEFGVKGPEAFQKDWLLKAAEWIKTQPEIVGLNYFNHQDVPQAWGDMEAPNWALSASTFNAFVTALSSSKED
jgi:beta-mannanase